MELGLRLGSAFALGKKRGACAVASRAASVAVVCGAFCDLSAQRARRFILREQHEKCRMATPIVRMAERWDDRRTGCTANVARDGLCAGALRA